MIGEYINMGLMILILGLTFWILRSPKKKDHGSNTKSLNGTSDRNPSDDEP